MNTYHCPSLSAQYGVSLPGSPSGHTVAQIWAEFSVLAAMRVDPLSGSISLLLAIFLLFLIDLAPVPLFDLHVPSLPPPWYFSRSHQAVLPHGLCAGFSLCLKCPSRVSSPWPDASSEGGSRPSSPCLRLQHAILSSPSQRCHSPKLSCISLSILTLYYSLEAGDDIFSTPGFAIILGGVSTHLDDHTTAFRSVS